MVHMIIFTRGIMKKDSMQSQAHLPSTSQQRKMSLQDEWRCRFVEVPSLLVLHQPMSTSSVKMIKKNMVSSRIMPIACSVSTPT